MSVSSNKLNCVVCLYVVEFIGIGKYSKYQEVPEDEFKSWLSLLLEQDGLGVLTEEQREEIRRQFCVCLVSIWSGFFNL